MQACVLLAPTEEDQLPDTQFIQAAEDVAPKLEENDPAGQLRHVLRATAPDEDE